MYIDICNGVYISVNLMIIHTFHTDLQFYILKTYHSSCIICHSCTVLICIVSIHVIYIHLFCKHDKSSYIFPPFIPLECVLSTRHNHWSILGSYLYPKLLMVAALRKHKQLQPNKLQQGSLSWFFSMFTQFGATMLDNLRHHDLLATRYVLYPTLEHHVLEPTRAAHELHQNTHRYVINKYIYIFYINVYTFSVYIYISLYLHDYMLSSPWKQKNLLNHFWTSKNQVIQKKTVRFSKL